MAMLMVIVMILILVMAIAMMMKMLSAMMVKEGPLEWFYEGSTDLHNWLKTSRAPAIADDDACDDDCDDSGPLVVLVMMIKKISNDIKPNLTL